MSDPPRKILCLACGAGMKPGVRETVPPSILRPSEYERVVFGRATPPEKEWFYAPGAPTLVSRDHYLCATCFNPIMPGERCCAVSHWFQNNEMAEWEAHYLKVETAV